MLVVKNKLNRIFLDTLFVVALVNHRDQYHRSASELAEQYEGYPLLTTNGVSTQVN
jgi:predicted nucleic acid-binding protein